MKKIEEDTTLLGEKFSKPYNKIFEHFGLRLGLGYSLWCDFKKTIYIDFSGYSDSEEMLELSNCVRDLHKELEIDSILKVAFYKTSQEATDKMIDKMKKIMKYDSVGL